ncbi:YbaK/EbsC family protein [Staphylococcus hyicus]|uniref:YbaK/EbsC family protein n=1 Tax=Staphylococcus hyicus TaxID=1284 RepID=UPI00273887B3|nr:YbaK/EbsC family protein [Staphylococcus hyicus]MDP4467639.1 YbaK/EbsC family protein [Staphylococcus hyicus]
MAKKTNAMRLLDKHNVGYDIRTFEISDAHVEGAVVATKIGVSPDQVFKTLVLESADRDHFVCVIPVSAQLDLKSAAQLIKDDDCIYIDAGSTTLEMIAHVHAQNVTVVTNGLPHVDALIKKGLQPIIVGGTIKTTTLAVVGPRAADSLKHYSFNKVFLGINGIDCDTGFTTPDEQEALMKENAMKQGLQTYILADASKFHQSYFARIHTEDDPIIITSQKAMDTIDLSRFKAKYEFLGGAE